MIFSLYSRLSLFSLSFFFFLQSFLCLFSCARNFPIFVDGRTCYRHLLYVFTSNFPLPQVCSFCSGKHSRQCRKLGENVQCSCCSIVSKEKKIYSIVSILPTFSLIKSLKLIFPSTSETKYEDMIFLE